jgi:uncharacterized protein (DUF433 family)
MTIDKPAILLERRVGMPTNVKATESWVQKTPGVCGGRACVRNTRITVWGLVNSRRLDAADEQILQNIASLTPADLQAAWDYYKERTAEIDRDISENEAESLLDAIAVIRPRPSVG